MAGLDPAIHVLRRGRIFVDDRVEPGHDDWREARQIIKCESHPLQGVLYFQTGHAQQERVQERKLLLFFFCINRNFHYHMASAPIAVWLTAIVP